MVRYVKTLLGCLLLGVVYPVRGADISVSDDGAGAEQSRPRIAVGVSGGFVVVWEDKRLGYPDVFFQTFDKFGYASGSNRRVADDTAATVRKQPSLATDYLGRFQLSWLDYRTSTYPLAPQVFGQRLDTLALPFGPNFRVTVEPPDSLRASPDIALSPGGNGLIVWEDYRHRHWDVYAQRISPNGTLIGQNFKINDDANASQQHAPRVAVAPDGWYVVVWYDNRSGNDDIFTQRLDSACNLIGRNTKVNSDAGSSRQAFPDVAADAEGHYTVVWTDWRNGTYPNNPDIFARKFDTLNVPMYTDVKVNRDGTLRAQRDPAISADRLGNVSIVWSDSGATSFDVLGQMIDVEGKIRETSFRANSSADSAQLQPDVALDGRKRYVCWTDRRKGNWDIYASITVYNNPTLVPNPTALNFSMKFGGPLPDAKTVVVNHTGYNKLNFTASTPSSWLTVSPESGKTVDSLSVRITNSTMGEGEYATVIRLVDVDNHDSSVAIPVVFTCFVPNTDTLRIGSARVAAGGSTRIPILFASADSVRSISAALKAASAGRISFDSITVGDADVVVATGSMKRDSTAETAEIRIDFDPAGPLPPGWWEIGGLWVTGLATGYTVVDTLEAVSMTTAAGLVRHPVFQSGEVQVDEPTDVEESAGGVLPVKFALAQNYPNPFNGATTISFDLPTVGPVSLELFNLLGQRVASLFVGTAKAGTTTVLWDGTSDNGAALPSGVYFYRLQAGPLSAVRKLIFLK